MVQQGTAVIVYVWSVFCKSWHNAVDIYTKHAFSFCPGAAPSDVVST